MICPSVKNGFARFTRSTIITFQDTNFQTTIVLKNTCKNSEAFGDFLIFKIVSKNVESAEMNSIFETIVKDATDTGPEPKLQKVKNLQDVMDEMELTQIVTQ